MANAKMAKKIHDQNGELFFRHFGHKVHVKANIIIWLVEIVGGWNMLNDQNGEKKFAILTNFIRHLAFAIFAFAILDIPHWGSTTNWVG